MERRRNSPTLPYWWLAIPGDTGTVLLSSKRSSFLSSYARLGRGNALGSGPLPRRSCERFGLGFCRGQELFVARFLQRLGNGLELLSQFFAEFSRLLVSFSGPLMPGFSLASLHVSSLSLLLRFAKTELELCGPSRSRFVRLPLAAGLHSINESWHGR